MPGVFQLVSKLSGHALSGGDSAGSPVVVSGRNEHDPHQLWFEDPSTGTIQNKATHLCIQAGDDNILYMKPVQPGHDAQQWTVGHDVVHHRRDTERVFDLMRSSKDAGAQVCAWKSHGGPNQHWDVIYQKPKNFYIKSEMNGKVLDIFGGNPSPGTKIIMWDQKKGQGSVNQLWYEDQQGVLRSRLNDFVMDASGKEIEAQPFDHNNPKRGFIINGSVISMRSDRDTVLDIISSNQESGATICAWKQHGGPNQKWRIESE